MSWVIRSPSCSALRMSRARPAAPRATSRASPAGARAERSCSAPPREEVEEDAVARDEREAPPRGKLAIARATSAHRARAGAAPSHSGGGSRRAGGRRRPASSAGISAIRAGSSPSRVFVPGADRHRALGVVAQREAGDAEEGRLLLDPAGVGEHGARVGLEREEVEVADRVDQAHALGSRVQRRRASCGSAGGRGRRPASRAPTSARRSIASASSGPSTSAGRCRVTSR